MANALIDGDLPPRWALYREATAAGGRQILRIGQRHIRIEDIRGLTGDEAREKPVAGLFIGSILFLISATIIAFMVLDAGWRPRYLIASTFLGALSVAGFIEVWKIRPQHFFEIKILTDSQGVVTFASTDQREVDGFLAALNSARAAA